MDECTHAEENKSEKAPVLMATTRYGCSSTDTVLEHLLLPNDRHRLPFVKSFTVRPVVFSEYIVIQSMQKMSGGKIQSVSVPARDEERTC